MVPDLRIRRANDQPIRPGAYVLYWMVTARRAQANYALDRALEHARTLGLGLVVFEPLRVAYPWASTRLHQFVLDGMRDNQRAFAVPGVTYLPYLEPAPGAGAGLLEALAAAAAVVVTDDFPCFFLPRMVAAAAARLPVAVEAVDGNGLIPLRATDHAYPTAYAFRRHIQTSLQSHLFARPAAEPFDAPLPFPRPTLPAGIAQRWPDAFSWLDRGGSLASLPIDQHVAPVTLRGGAVAARARLEAFVEERLSNYIDGRNDPVDDVTSGLSPYLHFGHVSAHEVFHRVMHSQGWLGHLPPGGRGAREGWWGVSPAAESFLDQLVTWREVGFNMCAHRPDHDHYASLPAWALATLARHADDPREAVYTRDEFDGARTHDPLWNAAQRQLTREGRMHNYLRMLWGKKILQWSATPEDALHTMTDLNNRYALDGRDPNSYSGIFWTLGRYDRPWGPEREVFGTIRYMSSENTARKVRVKEYLARYGDSPSLF